MLAFWFSRRPTISTATLLCPALLLLASAGPANAKRPSDPNVMVLASGLEGAGGSTIGPDKALYVTEGLGGRVSRIDPRTGKVTTFVDGLPMAIPGVGFGGPVDIAFVNNDAYVLVTLVGPDVGGDQIVGLYRVDRRGLVTLVADIGSWASENPPATDYELPTGVQYALEPYRNGFLITDGHHNRVLLVSREGDIQEFMAFSNVAPTGIAIRGNTVYMAEAGPIPHNPEDGQLVAFGDHRPLVAIAGGMPLLVDVELGRGNSLYALSQGVWAGLYPGDPALPNTGALVEVDADGGFTTIVDELDQPTSLEITGSTAFIVTLGGNVLRIDGVLR